MMVASSSHGSSGSRGQATGNSFERREAGSAVTTTSSQPRTDVPQLSSSLSTITAGAQGGISGITADTFVNINNYSGINLSLISENQSSEDGYSPKKVVKINIVDTDRVVNQDMLSEELKCRICHGVLINPLECNACENCFCMNCLQKWL